MRAGKNTSLSRNNFADFLKLALIFTVVLGHTIQYFRYNSDPNNFYNDYLLKWMYTFHMPLMVAISGYFSFLSIHKYQPREFLTKRIKQIGTPFLIWSIIKVVLVLILIGTVLDYRDIYILIRSNLWFLRALIAYTIIITLLRKMKADTIPCLTILSFVFMMLAVSPFNRFGMGVVFVHFPYFAIGYIIANKSLIRYYTVCKKYIFVLFIPLLIYMYAYDPMQGSKLIEVQDSISTTIFFLQHIKLSAITIIIAIIGSILFIYLMDLLFSKIKESKCMPILLDIAKETLGIYVIQDVFFYFYSELNTSKSTIMIPHVGYIIFNLLFIYLSYRIFKLCNRNKKIVFLLLGK